MGATSRGAACVIAALAGGVLPAPAEEVAGSPELAAETRPAAGAAAELAPLLAAGEGLYLANCRMCHGTNGTAGVPLAGNGRVYPEWVAQTMIRGPGYMPSFEALSDEDIAAIAVYVANSWGNDFGVVTPDVVAAFR